MTQTIDGLIERIAAIRPILEKNAGETERNRRVVDDRISLRVQPSSPREMVWQHDACT